MANKIKLGRATKARIETIKDTLDNYELVYSLDTKELGVKNNDGTITYIGAVTEIEWANVLNKPNFAEVATSGAYADLTGKPNLDLKLDKDFSNLPAQTNPLLTDVLVLNRGTTVQKVTLGNLLALIDSELFIVVSTLPTTGVANKIYLVPSDDPESIDNYVEWLWYDGSWERLGGFTLDLSNYFTKTEINSMLESKVDKNATIAPGTHPKITYDAKGLVTGGEALVADDIPNLPASKINSGTFAADRIPSLNASKINAGVFNVARIPDLAISKITGLQDALDNKLNLSDVYSWAKQPTKPSYTYGEVGAAPANHTHPEYYTEAMLNTKFAGLGYDSALQKLRYDTGMRFYDVASEEWVEDNFSRSGHNHIISNVDGLQAALDTKLDADSIIDGGDL